MIGINRYRIDKIRSDKTLKTLLDKRIIRRAYSEGIETVYYDREGNKCLSLHWKTNFFAVPANEGEQLNGIRKILHVPLSNLKYDFPDE